MPAELNCLHSALPCDFSRKYEGACAVIGSAITYCYTARPWQNASEDSGSLTAVQLGYFSPSAALPRSQQVSLELKTS